jgi:competence protein ComEA
MWDWLEKHRKPILLFLVALLLIGGAVFAYRQLILPPGQLLEISLAPPQEITVSVTGEVMNPGSYELPKGARVANAIKAAGGFTPDAYLGGLNLSQRLEDGDQIYVYNIEVLSKVNINTADAEILETLPGIGPVKAQAIIDYRNENGPFLHKEDLMQVKGIGETTYHNLEDKITVY